MKGYLSFGEFIGIALVSPVKLLFRFIAFLVGCVTFGHVNLADKFLLSTGDIKPLRFVQSLISLNIGIGLCNLAPIPPLDGGHAATALLEASGNHFSMPGFASFLLFIAFFISANKQDVRVLEIEPKRLG
jgi:Zn-dependent protease